MHPARLALAIVVGAIVLVVTAIVFGSGIKSPEQVAAEAAPPSPSVVTAKAEQRVLTEPLTARGTVMPGNSVKLRPPSGAVGGDAVVTAVPLRRGDTVRNGTVITEQAGQPIIAMALPFALYRDIGPDQAGPDVAAVQRALRALGYRAGSSGRFDAAAQAAVRRLLQVRGYRQLVGSVAPAAGADTTTTGDSGEVAKGTDRPGLTLRRAWFLRIKKPSQRVTAVRVKVDDVLTPTTVLAELDGGAPTVQITVSTEKAELLDVGRAARGVDEVAKKSVDLKVRSIGTVPQADAQTGGSGIPVTLSFTGERLSVSDRTLRVSVEAATSRAEVLAVPVTGVFSRPDGTQFVTVVQSSGELQDVSVQTGENGGGWVEVAADPPEAVTEGTQIVVGQS